MHLTEHQLLHALGFLHILLLLGPRDMFGVVVFDQYTSVHIIFLLTRMSLMFSEIVECGSG